MYQLNSFIMAGLMGLLFFLINGYLPIAPLISLLFNMLMLTLIVLYIMQGLGVIRNILPVFVLFK